jgi:A/G-specific adenine glycosylase
MPYSKELPEARQPGKRGGRRHLKSAQPWAGKKNSLFQTRLLAWYEQNRRELPWRSRPTPYRVWISEIMLQQTQVSTVLPYFSRFMRRFPNVTVLSAASEEEVMALWAGLGYYRRARNLLPAARIIVRQFKGKFPDSLGQIRELPGVGRYTAAAICSIAFNQPQPLVDGNVRRLITRLHALTFHAREDFFWGQAEAWQAEKRPSDFNQAVMELGALLCRPSTPKCPVCPVRSLCAAHAMGIQHRIPTAPPKHAIENWELVVLVLESQGNVLLVKEKAASYLPGVWNLPATILKPQTAPQEAAKTFVRRMLGKAPVPLIRKPPVRHSITFRRIRAHVFHVDFRDYPLKSCEGRRVLLVDTRQSYRLLTSSLYKKALRSALR